MISANCGKYRSQNFISSDPNFYMRKHISTRLLYHYACVIGLWVACVCVCVCVCVVLESELRTS
jgi:hypothetical protein